MVAPNQSRFGAAHQSSMAIRMLRNALLAVKIWEFG